MHSQYATIDIVLYNQSLSESHYIYFLVFYATCIFVYVVCTAHIRPN